MRACYPCGTSCDCGAWGQCSEGPSWPPGGLASRSPWWGTGLACPQVQAMQVPPPGCPAGTAGVRAAAGKTCRASES